MPQYIIDPEHSIIEFKVQHLMISSVRGFFKKFTGGIITEKKTMSSFDKELSETSIWCEIDVGSICTNIKERDDHLRSSDFFDVENHPKMFFQSTEVRLIDRDQYKLRGMLQIRGESKEIELDCRYNGSGIDNHGVEKFGYDIDGKILRSTWFLDFNIPGGKNTLLIGNEVSIDISIQVIKC